MQNNNQAFSFTDLLKTQALASDTLGLLNQQQQATDLLKIIELLKIQEQANNPLQMQILPPPPQLSQIVGGHPPPPQIQPDAEIYSDSLINLL